MDRQTLEAYVDACQMAAETGSELGKLGPGGYREALKGRMERAERVKRQVEQWMDGIPLRMQRIITYKIFEGMQWEQAAARMGRNATGDSIRMELRRFLEEN
ncbi:MAG: RNA polymerase subunit sigma-70 [Bacilli bacterium]|nr:RNA polymerase subunit sigma-70 [Bacilli bacterium]